MTLVQLRKIAKDASVVIENGRTKFVCRPNSEESKALFHLIRCINSDYTPEHKDLTLLGISLVDEPREPVVDAEPVRPTRFSLIDVD